MTTGSRMYHYYQEQAVLPTYARLKTPDDLAAHERRRKALFVEKLCLPPQVFQGARLVEFGPDAGENALVFARWGAALTLVEPNPNCWARIEEYFDRFGLQDRLRALEKVDLERFDTEERFRIIDAEGFIYTIKPESIWIDLFSRLLEPEGFLILFYYERFGAFVELLLKLIYARAKELVEKDATEVAWRLFQAKWNAIPHTRSFHSWVMDVLENPFVRLKYFFDAGTLCAQCWEGGLSFYSSWPRYHDGLQVSWYKREIPPSGHLEQNAEFIARSRLSFAVGSTLFVCAQSDAVVRAVTDALDGLLRTVDGLLDGFEATRLTESERHLDTIDECLRRDAVLADSSQAKAGALRFLETLRELFQLLRAGDVEPLIAFCNSNPAFIETWGVPGHFAVFRKTTDVGGA